MTTTNGDENYEIPFVQEEQIVDAVVAPRYREVWVNASAYTASVAECGKDDGITASGVTAVEGVTVASDDLELGTEVIINNHTYIVQDRFGGGYRNRVDIYHSDVSRAMQFGRQRILIKILEE
jgi:3D (Asp-Asp-Asp) domain-containing protein